MNKTYIVLAMMIGAFACFICSCSDDDEERWMFMTDDFTSDDDEERWQLITDDFNTTIPITKIRVLNRKAIKSNYCCISFSTLPAKKVDCNKFFINFWTLTIGDNISNSISWGVPISNCVHRGGNWYEFEFSRPVYFAYYQDFCPRGQVKAYK